MGQETAPEISVVVPLYNEEENVEAFHAELTASLEQLGRSFEVVLVDDGSAGAESQALLEGLRPEFARRGWTLERQANRYLGAARNAAARIARGEYLLFADDDNVHLPHAISTLVRAALRTGADVVTDLMDLFGGAEPPRPPPRARALFLGAAPAVGAFRNCFGDASALWRRETFFALGGFSEDVGLGYEDWELFARAVLRGARLELVPEPLHWYRVGEGSMLRSAPAFASHMRRLRPYLEAVPDALRDVVLLAHGLAARRERTEAERRREAPRQEGDDLAPWERDGAAG